MHHDKKALAEDGLDRDLHGEGIYSAEGELSSLQKKVHDPLTFWRHVARSTLDCDVVFVGRRPFFEPSCREWVGCM